jgi:hypothetical protein
MIKLIIINALLSFALGSMPGCTEDELSYSNGDYFVATNGNDKNPGTIAQPWATWQKAFNTANAGDTVYIRGGVYLSNAVELNPGKTGLDGEEGNPICFYNYPGEAPILDLSTYTQPGNYITGIYLYRSNFIKFRGITVRNVWQRRRDYVQALGIYAYGSSNLTFENVTVHNIGGNAFRYLGENGFSGILYDTVLFKNCDAYNCCDSVMIPGDIAPGRPGNSADGWKLDNEKGAYALLEGCRAWNCSDDGFDLSGSWVCEFRNCWSFNNGHLGGDGTGFKTGAVRDSLKKVNRIMTNCIAANNIAGIYLLEYPDYYRTNARIYNNATFNNSAMGYFIDNNADRPWVLSVFRNNLSYKDAFAVAASYLDYNESHNTWDDIPAYPGYRLTDTVTVTDADFLSVDSKQLSVARKKNGSLPDINFLKLSSTSDLIDAGINVGLPFSGKAPDIGAFEKK